MYLVRRAGPADAARLRGRRATVRAQRRDSLDGNRRPVAGRGLGTILLDTIDAELAGAGVQTVEVKTLDASAAYPPYERTRRFWEHRGFVQVRTIDPMPGWRPGNPAAVYVATL